MSERYERALAAICSNEHVFSITSPAIERLNIFVSELSSQTREWITRDELVQIARFKNGEKLSQKTRAALLENDKTVVETLTKAAFSSPSEEERIRMLTGLEGVRVPTASCILAWKKPDRWGVIDRRAWASLIELETESFRPTSILKASHWVRYERCVTSLAEQTDRTPREIDMWLYHWASPRNRIRTAF